CLAACPRAAKSRRNDLRVIENKRVARPEKLRQVTDGAILELLTLNDQKLRAVARACRTQCDAFFRKIKVEQIDAHVNLTLDSRAECKAWFSAFHSQMASFDGHENAAKQEDRALQMFCWSTEPL